jgi:enamine deaminase RidA (YjgF/YER057c/UK114 family)
MALERMWPEDVYVRALPNVAGKVYTQVVRSAGAKTRVHVAGTFGFDRDGQFEDGMGMREQTRRVMENIGRSLAVAGATPADVVRTKTYVTDIEAYVREGHQEWMAFFGDTQPVSTAVQIVALADPRAVVEIEAYAEID